ncbi:TPA: hypothetical protein ACINSR_001769 [Streptococcus agalactiae]
MTHVVRVYDHIGGRVLPITRKVRRMKLSTFIELLQEDDMNPDWEVTCGIAIDPPKRRIWFPEPHESVEE